MNRKIIVHTSLAFEPLRFSAMQGYEHISQLFNFDVTLKSLRKDIDPQVLLGTSISLSVELDSGLRRYLNGQCNQFRLSGKEGRHYLYSATLKPWLWHAQNRYDYRMFQNMTVQAMIEQVLAPYPFKYRFALTQPYREWEYCVQYGESDLNFIMRMLENEGMWFWFEHHFDEHVLVITDEISLCQPCAEYPTVPYYDPDTTFPGQDSINTWSAGCQVLSGQYSSRDYNFTMPNTELPMHNNLEAGHAHDNYEVFNYPGGYTNLDEADQYARVRMEALQSEHMRGKASSNVRGFAPGYLFSLANHPANSQNREYLIVSATYDWSESDYEARLDSQLHQCSVEIETHDTSRPFRAACNTPKPRSMGPETATVTGPEGQEIYTDEHGRVKVSFPWNRYCSKDENSSCWIRVSHPWAGSGFGGMHVPRIGQEVLVDYLNGDPDRPVITSRVYNAYQTPPWALPANATQSGFLTRSSMGGTSDNANALRFEDKKGAEQLWIHAERNQDIEVENDETHWVGNDRRKTIDRDETSQIKRDRTETVDRDETITVHGNRKEHVDGNETISIDKNRTETVTGNEKVTIHGNRKQTIDQNRTDKIRGNWSAMTNQNKSETIGLTNMQNVGMVSNENIGMVRASVVGMQRIEFTGMNKGVTVGQNRQTTINKDDQLTVVESLTVKGKKITISADDELTLNCGGSTIKLTPDLIELISSLIKINA